MWKFITLRHAVTEEEWYVVLNEEILIPDRLHLEIEHNEKRFVIGHMIAEGDAELFDEYDIQTNLIEALNKQNEKLLGLYFRFIEAHPLIYSDYLQAFTDNYKSLKRNEAVKAHKKYICKQKREPKLSICKNFLGF